MHDKQQKKDWRARLHEIIYEADTPEGKLFDVILLIAIIASIFFVMLESIKEFDARYHNFLNIAEWIITIILSSQGFSVVDSYSWGNCEMTRTRP